MESVSGKYNAAQLCHWLQHIGLPSTGTKNALLLRLNKVPTKEREEYPGGENENFENDLSGGQEANEYKRGRNTTNESSMNECDTNDRNIPQMKEKQDFEFLGNLLKKELEIVRREKELLKKGK